MTTPICLDESVLSAAHAAMALDMGACSIVNIKVGRVGGVLEAKHVHDVCRARGVPVWCGGMLETGVGRAANVALASLPGFVFPADISASDRYWERDITEPFVLDGSSITVPTRPGLGVTVDQRVLDDLGAQVSTPVSWQR
jgi:O-succinylbenzoate synthase